MKAMQSATDSLLFPLAPLQLQMLSETPHRNDVADTIVDPNTTILAEAVGNNHIEDTSLVEETSNSFVQTEAHSQASQNIMVKAGKGEALSTEDDTTLLNTTNYVIPRTRVISSTNDDLDKAFDEELKTFDVAHSEASEDIGLGERDASIGEGRGLYSSDGKISKQLYTLLHAPQERLNKNGYIAGSSKQQLNRNGCSLYDANNLIELIESCKLTVEPIGLSPLSCFLLRHPLHREASRHHVHTLANSIVKWGYRTECDELGSGPLVALRYENRTEVCRKECVGQPPIPYVLVPEIDGLPVYYVISGASRCDAVQYAMRVQLQETNVQSCLRTTIEGGGCLPFYVLNGDRMTNEQCVDLCFGLEVAGQESCGEYSDLYPFVREEDASSSEWMGREDGVPESSWKDVLEKDMETKVDEELKSDTSKVLEKTEEMQSVEDRLHKPLVSTISIETNDGSQIATPAINEASMESLSEHTTQPLYLMEKLQYIVRTCQRLVRKLQSDVTMRQLAIAIAEEQTISRENEADKGFIDSREDILIDWKSDDVGNGFTSNHPSRKSSPYVPINEQGNLCISEEFKWLVWIADVLCPFYRSLKEYDMHQRRWVIPGLLFNSFAAQIRHLCQEYARYDIRTSFSTGIIGRAMSLLIDVSSECLKKLYGKNGLPITLRAVEGASNGRLGNECKENESHTNIAMQIKQQIDDWDLGQKIPFYYLDRTKCQVGSIPSVDSQNVEELETTVWKYSFHPSFSGIFDFNGASVVALIFSLFVHQDENCYTEESWRVNFKRNSTLYYSHLGRLVERCRSAGLNLMQCCHNIRLRILEASSLLLRFALSGCDSSRAFEYRPWKPFPTPIFPHMLVQPKQVESRFAGSTDEPVTPLNSTTPSPTYEETEVILLHNWMEVSEQIGSVLLKDLILPLDSNNTEKAFKVDRGVAGEPLGDWLANRRPEVMAVVVKLLEGAQKATQFMQRPKVQSGDFYLTNGYEIKILDASVLPMAREGCDLFVETVLPVSHRILKSLSSHLTVGDTRRSAEDAPKVAAMKGRIQPTSSNSNMGASSDPALEFALAAEEVAGRDVSDVSVLSDSSENYKQSHWTSPSTEKVEGGKSYILLPACLPIMAAIRVCVNLLPHQFDALAPQTVDWMEARKLLGSWVYEQTVNGIIKRLQHMEETANATVMFSMAQSVEWELKAIDMEIALSKLQPDIKQLLMLFEEACFTKKVLSPEAFWQKGEGVQFILPKILRVLHFMTKGAEPISIAPKESMNGKASAHPFVNATHSTRSPKKGSRVDKAEAKGTNGYTAGLSKEAYGNYGDDSAEWNGRKVEFGIKNIGYRSTETSQIGWAVGDSSANATKVSAEDTGFRKRAYEGNAAHSDRFSHWMQPKTTDHTRSSVVIPYMELTGNGDITIGELSSWEDAHRISDGGHQNDIAPNPLSELDWKVVMAVLKLLSDRGVDTLFSSNADLGFVLKDIFSEEDANEGKSNDLNASIESSSSNKESEKPVGAQSRGKRSNEMRMESSKAGDSSRARSLREFLEGRHRKANGGNGKLPEAAEQLIKPADATDSALPHNVGAIARPYEKEGFCERRQVEWEEMKRRKLVSDELPNSLSAQDEILNCNNGKRNDEEKEKEWVGAC